MQGDSMDLLRTIFSALGFDCFRLSSSSAQRSAFNENISCETGLEGSSRVSSFSLEPDSPHCQSCISYGVRLNRLACGHMFCNACDDRIIEDAFLDIEGLSDYPCPMCKSVRQLGLLVPGASRPHPPSGTPRVVHPGGPVTPLQRQVIKEEEEEDSRN